MQQGKLGKWLLAFGLITFLTACGGTSGGADGSSDSNGDDTDSGASPGDGTTKTTPVLVLGLDEKADFQAGLIQAGSTSLAAAAKTELLLNVVDSAASNALYLSDVTVQFTSACVTSGLASFSNDGEITTSSGSISLTYTDNGCGVIGGKNDKISARITSIDGENVTGSATASITIQIGPALVESLSFSALTPSQIEISQNQSENFSLAKFLVQGKNGIPVSNHPVRGSLSGTNGGVSLIDSVVETNNEGIATFKILAGRTKTEVLLNVETDILSEDGTSVVSTLKKQSDVLMIDSGLPVNHSFTLTTETFNPRSNGYRGTKVKIYARLADIYGNPVKDGTVVSFEADKNGYIEHSCVTANGGCDVTWESNSNRYADLPDPTDETQRIPDSLVTIIARTRGEMIENDPNGNGYWDIDEPFSELNEPMLDANDNGEFNAETDWYHDTNGDKKYNAADEYQGIYRGSICSSEALAANTGENKPKHCEDVGEIWRTIKLVNSSGDQTSLEAYLDNTILEPNGTIALNDQLTSVQFVLTDENGNTPPVGTNIEFTVTNGEIVAGNEVTTIPSTEGQNGKGYHLTLALRGDDEPSLGALTVKTESLEGVIQRYVYNLDDRDDAVSSTVNLKLGIGEGATFDPGKIQSADAIVKAGKSTKLTVNVVDSSKDNNLYSDQSSQVTFTSTCSVLGKAEFSPATVTTTDGIATTTYIDKGCAEANENVGTFTDKVIATLVSDSSATAITSFSVNPAEVGAVEFSSSTFDLLALQGFATATKPTITETQFRVTDKYGNAIADRPIDFVLEGASGGAALLYTSSLTNQNGSASVRLKSGNRVASVRVKAIVKQVDSDGNIIGEETAISDPIAINTRLPTKDGFNLEATILNPHAYDVVGTEVEIKATLKDSNNVSVDDGTLVSFDTDNNGYFDEDTCTTEDGACKVIWRSSRSSGYDGDYIISILARAEGVAGFTDTNGNEMWDVGEPYNQISEAYLDVNDDDDFDFGVDLPFDYNSDGVPANPASDFVTYRGVACSEAAIAAVENHCEELVEVWQSISLINSAGGTATVELNIDGSLVAPGSEIKLTGTKEFSIYVRDAEGNLPPAGSKITLFVNNGSIVAGASTYTVESQFRQPNQPFEIKVGIKADPNASIDDFIIEVENTDGTITRQTYELNDGVEEGPAENVDLAIGNGTAAAFDEGVASVTIGAGATLPSGGSTTVKVDIVDKNASNSAYTSFTNVYFTSSCVAAGLAEFSPSIVQASGSARSTYRDKGCASEAIEDEELQVMLVELDDQDNIKLVIAEAKTDIRIAPAQVSSIQFMSTIPEAISLKGLGSNAVMPEISQISFRVLDKNNEPMAGRDVRFSLSNELPGVELTRSSASSDANGIATVQLTSGYSHGSVSVIAEIDILDEFGNKIDDVRVWSSSISISTGLPTQQSFSLSLDKNSAWGWDATGNTVTVTASLADQYGNFVPDGTQVVFVTEGGAIGSNCTTENGSCFVTWESQNYRPLDGIATITARVEGVADFQDDNSNGLFDIGEAYEYYGESYLDADDSGTFNPNAAYLPDLDIDDDGINEFNWLLNDPNRDNENENFKEEFYDHNGDKTYTSRSDKSGDYQGVTCSDDAKAVGHCAESVQLTKSARIVMSDGSNAFIEGPFEYDDTIGTFDTSNVLSCVDVGSTVRTVGWRVSDSQERRNKLPSGATLSISGEDVDILAESGTGTVESIVNIAYPHGTPTGSASQKALYRENYLFARGHMVYAQVGVPDEADTTTGKLNMTAGTPSGVDFESALLVAFGPQPIKLMNGLEVLGSVDIHGGAKRLTVEVSDDCGFGLSAGSEISVSTNNGLLSNPTGDTNHVVATMDGANIRVVLTGEDFEGEANRFSFDLAPDGDSNTDNFSLVISTSNGRIDPYTVKD